MPRRLGLTRRVVVPAVVVLVAAVAFGLYFQPWKALTDTAVDEALPGAAASAHPSPMKPKDMREREGKETKEMRHGPVDLARGHFVTHEHGTSGTARTVRLADKSRVLRLEDLRTSEGPDVHVYLSMLDAQAVKRGLGEGAIELGKLKGNLGNQNYAVPAGTDLGEFHSAVIWCERFSVSFGAADLAPAKG